MSDDPIIRVSQLSYQYPRSRQLALRDIDLTVQQSEVFGLIGPTGAGRSTLCLTLNGIVPQFYGGRFFGHVQVAGLDTLETPISDLARHVALVLQDPETQLIANSVLDEVAFGLENTGTPRAQIMERAAWALAALRLDGMEQRHPSELSGGEKQRLALAAALAMRPQVLVLDEPTSQLDPKGGEELLDAIRLLNRDFGITLVWVSHATEELAALAHRIGLLHEGQLVEIGAPGRVLGRPDLLSRYSVRPPQVTQLFHCLHARGLAESTSPVTLDDAEQGWERERAALQVSPDSATPQIETQVAPVVLSAQSVSFCYPNGTMALRDVSLDVHQGEYVVIIGPNGAGKTTLARHFLHLLEPASGRVLVAGQDVFDMGVSALAQGIGFVAQNPDNQIFTGRVEDEVAFAPRLLGLSGEEMAVRVEDSLRQMGLLHLRSRHPLSLPKGDRARVVVAAVLAMRPGILIFDEPTTGQDYLGAMRILEVTKALQGTGKTVVVITHHLYLMPDYAQRAVVMSRGSIVLDAPMAVALTETDLLRANQLSPPQIVQFARYLADREGVALSAFTPEALAQRISPREARP
jgi:energy-coupling factor transporter ATP-binding protein EcfA2